MTIEEEWVYHNRYELQRRYGAGTFIAVYDWAVIDWGTDPDAVRQRAESTVRDTLFVGPVPVDSTDGYPTQADHAAFEAYRARRDATGDKRRYRIAGHNAYPNPIAAYHAIAELDITGKTEFVDGVVVLDGVEKRYADHDYRLMVEHGIVPKDTELIAGIVFRKKGARPPDDEAGFAHERLWMAYYGDTLRRRYGIGTVVAIFEAAVVDFGETVDEVRSRVESMLGESVFVAAVPETSPVVEVPDKRSAYRRRVLFTVEKWYAGGEYLGGNELLDGVIWDEGQERRYADHDYRLLLKHEIVSHETVLVGGIMFWKKGREPRD